MASLSEFLRVVSFLPGCPDFRAIGQRASLASKLLKRLLIATDADMTLMVEGTPLMESVAATMSELVLEADRGYEEIAEYLLATHFPKQYRLAVAVDTRWPRPADAAADPRSILEIEKERMRHGR